MSKITFIGTGAADWEIKDKGEFFRRNSAALINDDLAIDFGEHVYDFAESFDKKDIYDNVKSVLVTHDHSDHYNKESILKLADKQEFSLACSPRVRGKIGEHNNITYVDIKPYEEFKIGDYTVMPVLANHHVVIEDDDFALHYIIKTADGKILFYGCDGAWFLRPTWEEMKKYKFDAMVFDCTVGDSDDWRLFEHNTIPMLRTMIKEVKAREMIKPDGSLVASHLARTLHGSHEETAEILKAIDMLTAYDGYELNF